MEVHGHEERSDRRSYDEVFPKYALQNERNVLSDVTKSSHELR